MDNYIKLLSTIPLFAGVEKDDITKMLDCLNAIKKNYKRSEYIKHEGDDIEYLGIILEGSIQIFKYDYDGNRNIISTFNKGDMFAEAFICANMPKIPVNIIAINDCTILYIHKDHFLNPNHNCPFHTLLTRNLLRIVSMKNLHLNQKLDYLSRKTTKDKLIAYLLDQSRINNSTEFTIPYDRQGLADYLGVERSAMALVISSLVKEGLIQTKRSYFKLLKLSSMNSR